MSYAEIKLMRKKQFLTTNILFSSMMAAYFIFISVVPLTFRVLFLSLGCLFLLQTIYGYIKKSSGSPIPIFKKVEAYEKEKLGKEWDVQKKVDSGINLFLSGFMFFQAFFIMRETTRVNIDYQIMAVLYIVFLLVVNLSLYFHVKKIDGAESGELQGYTKKSNVYGVLFGILLAAVLFLLLIMYVLLS
ncbi:hypothetical protein LF817_02015 [Halobacillus sp. A1]|uniref:hypothetical protein n=1 Tax=Halobacillus sp. A1 TaxID=2880262 RepID=UPI0020A6A385|nr:hypothetical protein [Halobacillus sp. A1]MCP3030111.1 hypothetical protein [Halobacillus sp. A1]